MQHLLKSENEKSTRNIRACFAYFSVFGLSESVFVQLQKYTKYRETFKMNTFRNSISRKENIYI